MNRYIAKSISRQALPLLALAAAIIIGLSSCQETDVVATGAISGFKNMTTALGADRLGVSAGTLSLTSPAGDLFTITASGSSGPVLAISLDAAPFLAAGLNPAALSAPTLQVADTRLVLSFDWTGQTLNMKPAADAQTTWQNAITTLVAQYRTRFGYHQALDHYGIEVGGGNMVEWARDLATNDKDLVIVIEPAPLVAAGLNPDQVEGWIHAAVEVMDAKGNKTKVQKLLRPFSLD